jgi:O-antigen/teichoic acid export membrane protein
MQTLVNTFLLFVTIPVFLRLLGTEEYGVFSLIMVIGSLNTIVNLGLNSTLIKFLAEQGKGKESNLDILVNLIIILSVLVPLTMAAIAFHRFVLVSVLGISPARAVQVRWLYFYVLVSNSLLILGQTFSAILESLQKVYVTNVCQMIYNLAYWGLILLVLLLGFDLNAVGAMALVASSIWFSIIIAAAFGSWGSFSASKLRSNFNRVAKKQLRYGMPIFFSSLVNFFYEPFTKILLSHFIGVHAVAVFDIALKIRNQIWGLISKIFQPLYPLLAQLADMARLRRIVHDLEQKSFFLVVPFIPIVIFTTRPLISIWLRENVEIISVTVIFILSAYLVAVTVIPNYQFLMAKGHASKTIVLQGSNVVFNALFFLLTFRWLGYYAVVVGNVGAIMSSYVLSLYYQKKYLNSLIFDSWIQLAKLTAILVGCYFVGFIGNALIDSAWLKLGIIPILIGSVALVLFRALRLFSPEDVSRYAGKKRWLVQVGTKVLCRS